MHPAQRPLAKAEAAISAYRTSSDLDGAEDAWCDFLHHWIRAVNKYDAHGRHVVGPGWRQLKSALRSNERLTYLWEARNTEEHTIAPVAGRKPAAVFVNPIAIDIGDGLVIGLDGEVGVGLGNGVGLTFAPESLHLVEIRGKRGGEIYSVPQEHRADLSPLDLMLYGYDFLVGLMTAAASRDASASLISRQATSPP